MGASLLLIAGGLCLLYCLMIGIFVEHGTKFFLVWGVLGAGLMGLGCLIGRYRLLDYLPEWIKISVTVLAAAGILLFLIIEGLILSKFWSKPPDGADYCIILGAQIKENGPSEVLRRRLDAAITYLQANEGTKVIVSGGQGANEPMSEAQGMYEYLVSAGVEESRILLEDQSLNTHGNLAFSAKLLDMEEERSMEENCSIEEGHSRKTDTIVVVTNNFHVFRALGIAKKMGYEKVYGLATDSYPGMLPNNMMREFLGVVKDFLVGNL